VAVASPDEVAGWAAEADVVCDGVDEAGVVGDACSGSLSCLNNFLSLSIVRVCGVAVMTVVACRGCLRRLMELREEAVNSNGGRL